MKYQEKVATRADVRALFERVRANPAISHYRGYTATASYGWDAEVKDYCKREGEAFFENPSFDPHYVLQGCGTPGEPIDEYVESECVEALRAERGKLCRMIDTLNDRIAAYEKRLCEVSAERDEALRALAALREALLAIRRLAEQV